MLEKTGLILTTYLKKDAIKISFWLIAIWSMSIGMIAYFPTLYATKQDMISIAMTMQNPFMIAMTGPLNGDISQVNLGMLSAQQLFVFSAILSSIMSISLALTNTVKEEENGCLELINSQVVGRAASISANILEIILINMFNCLVITVGSTMLQVPSIDLIGSFTFALSISVVGIFFGLATILFAQFVSSLRTVSIMAYSFLGISYLIRAVGDVSNSPISWLSAFAWGTKTKMFVTNNFNSIYIALIIIALIVVATIYINIRRDLQGSLINFRSKTTRISSLLNHPFGFVLKIERSQIIIWMVVSVIIGVSYGSVFGDIELFLDNPEVANLISTNDGNSIYLQFFEIISLINSIILTIPIVIFFNHMYQQEKTNRIELLYATSLSRIRYLTCYIIISLLIIIIGNLLCLVSFYLVSNQTMNVSIPFTDYLSIMLSYFPSIIFILGLGCLIIGSKPKLLKVISIYLLFSFVLIYFGRLFALPDYVFNLSVFSLTNHMNIVTSDYIIYSILLFVSLLLMVGGYINYKKRDLNV